VEERTHLGVKGGACQTQRREKEGEKGTLAFEKRTLLTRNAFPPSHYLYPQSNRRTYGVMKPYAIWAVTTGRVLKKRNLVSCFPPSPSGGDGSAAGFGVER